MPFLLAEILNFQGSTHRIGVGSFSYILKEYGAIYSMNQYGVIYKERGIKEHAVWNKYD